MQTDNMIQIDVSGDGSCMLHSIALAYLMPVFDNDREFAKRFKELFGNDQIRNLLKINEDLKKIEKNSIEGNPFASISNNKDWKDLIQRFRGRLVEHMKSHKSQYESFFASDHHEDYSTRNFNDYLGKIGKETTWLGNLEVRAASDLLQYPIKVNKPSLSPQTYNDDLQGPVLEIFHVNGNHYNFGLDEGLLGRLSPHLNLSPNKSPSYPREEPNQRAGQSGDSDSSGDERSAKRNLFNTVEGNNFKEVKKILDNFKGDLKSLINAQDANNDNNTPLYMAIKKGSKKNIDKDTNKRIIKLLIERGADVNIKNSKDKTPFNLVEEQLKKNPNDPNWQSIKDLLEQAQPSTFGIKKTSKNTDIEPDINNKISLKRRLSEDQNSNLSKRPRIDPSLDPNPTYDASGVKRALDGTIYQSKLLGLFVKRAIDKEYDFRLATEMDAAEKFDDVVFKYQDQGKWTYRFLQAKHKQNPQRDKITVNDLKTEQDGNFSLQKYFVSFCKIKENPLFQGGDLKDFIIATNTDFDFSENLDLKKDGTPTKRAQEHNALIEKWKNFFDIRSLSNDDEILYFGKGEKTVQFKKDAQTKAAIEKEIKSALEKNIKEINGRILKGANTALQEGLRSLQHFLDNNFTDNVGDFLERLIFITNYPSEKELGGFIKRELGEEFDLLNADLVSDSFEREMLDFLKSYDKGKAKFYSWKDGENFFKAIKGKINTLMVSGLSKSHLEELRTYGIRFKENLESLNDFLSNDQQIFHLSSQSTRLSAIKTLQTLENQQFRSNYDYLNKEDGYIFMPLKTLLGKETQDLVIKSFSSDQTHHLLVIECQAKNQGKANEIGQLFQKLSIALSNSSKRITLIAQGEDSFAAKFKDSQESKYHKEDDRTSFEDLDEDSQKKILEKRVNFQGKEISLNQLINENSAGKIIDQTHLSRLLEGEKIEIGDTQAFSSIGYVKDYYIERKLHHQRIEAKVFKEKIESDLFFVSRANKEDLTALRVKEEDIYRWEDGKTYEKGIILSVSEPSSGQKNQEIFQKLGKQSGKNVHWLEYQEGNLFWRNSKGNFSALKDYIDKDYVPDEKNTLKEEDFSKPGDLGQKVVIIANDPGVGKSTVLTNIAREIKQKDPALWVVRINLSDYAIPEEEPQSLHNIKFQENETDKAIEFVSGMAVHGNLKDTNIQFQRKLFKTGLKDDNKLKIVIQFDGFDEISPAYKAKTHTLLRALKGNKFAQLWVTTRVHEKNDLEKELESPAYILNPLTKEEQKEYLNKFWRWSLKFSKEEDFKKAYKKIREHLEEIKSLSKSFSNEDLKKRISEILPEAHDQKEPSSEKLKSLREAIDEKDENGKYKLDFSGCAEELLNQWKISIRDSQKTFTNVPLNLGILAEATFEKNFQLPKSLGLLSLYDDFIKVKFDIYREYKSKTSRDNLGAHMLVTTAQSSLDVAHQELAVKLFFPKEYEERSLPNLRELNKFKINLGEGKKLEQELARIGLLTLQRNQFEFIHRSYAEYFLSKYLFSNLKEEQVQKLLLEKILSNEDYALIHTFFNDQLRLEKNLHPEIKLNADVKKFLLENGIGKTSFHIAALEGSDAIIKFLLKDTDEHFKTLLLETDGMGRTALHWAAERGHTDIIRTLLNELKDHSNLIRELVLKTDGIGRTALHWAAEKGYTETLNALLDSVENIKYLSSMLGSDMFGNTPLHLAGYNNYAEVVETLLDWQKKNLNYPSTFKAWVRENNMIGQILYWVAWLGKKDIVEVLLDVLKDYPDLIRELVLKTDGIGRTALHWAAQKGYAETLKALLDSVKGDTKTLKDLMLATDRNNQTALHLAILWGKKDTIKALLDELKDHSDLLGGLMLATSRDNQTALYWAIGEGKEDIAKTLLDGVKGHPNLLRDLVLKTDDIGRTVLHLATEKGYTEIIRALLDNVKGDTEILKDLVLTADEYGNQTALHLAVSEGGKEDTVKALLDGINGHSDLLRELVLKTDGIGRTALHWAAEKGYTETVKALLDSLKGDTETLKKLVLADDQDNRTALHLAAEKGHTETVKTLLDWVKENLDTEAVKKLVLATSEYETPLHWAAEKGHTETVKELLDWVKKNLDTETLEIMVLATNEYDEEQSTALHWAAEKGHTETVKELLDWVKKNLGIEMLETMILVSDNSNQTALHWAAEKGYTNTVTAFLDSVKGDTETLKGLMLATDKDRKTALHLTAQNGHTETAIALLNWTKENLDTETLRALVLATDQSNRTALDLAIDNNDNQVTDLLKKSYDEITSSLLNPETRIPDFNNTELKVLKRYVTNNDYNGENKQEILNKINDELNKRPQPSNSSQGSNSNDGASERSEESRSNPEESSGGGSRNSDVIPFVRPGLFGGNPSDAGGAPEVLRLRGGSSLAERYMEGYNLTKSLSKELHRLLKEGKIQKGELPILFDTEQMGQKQWKVPLIRKDSLDAPPKYFTTEQEIFSQVKDYLQEQAKNISPYYREDLGDLSLREEVPGEAVDGLNSSFLAQAVFNWVRHGFGPELQEGMGEDLSKILKAQFYVQVSMMAHGALSDTKSVVDNVKLLMREEAMAVETFNSFEHCMLSSANSALGLGLGGAMVVLDALELSKLTDPSARAIVTTQLVFDSLNLSLGSGALLSGIIASKAAAGSILAEVAATSSAALGYLAVPLAGIGIGITALVQVNLQAIEQAKGVGRMLNVLKKELQGGYAYDEGMQSFIPPSLAPIKKLTLTSEGISTQFGEQRYNRFRSGWHNVEPIREGTGTYGSFLKTLNLPDTLEIKKRDQQQGGTLVMPYIPSKDYDFSLGAAAGSYSRWDAEFATGQELQKNDPGFHFQVLFYAPIPFDHIIRSYRIKYKKSDVEVVVKEGNWNLIFPWVYDKASQGAKERKEYIKKNAEHIVYKIKAEGLAKEITLGLPPLEFPLNLSLSQQAHADVKWFFEVTHLDRDLSVRLEADLLHIGSFKVRLSKISKDQLFFIRKRDEFFQEGTLSSNGVEWKDVEIITDGKDLQSLKEKLHTQISLHKGHEDYLKVETGAKDEVTYYDVGRNRYIKTPLSFEEGGKSFYAREALLLNVEGEHAYFYAPWDGHPLGDKAQEKLPLLFWGVDINTGKALHPERISFSSSEALSKCIEISPGEGFELSTKLYHGLGTTFLEERYESHPRKKKGVKLLWQLAKGQKPGDLDLYLHAIEGVSKQDCIKSFDHLADQVMIKDAQGKVKWWMRKEKEFVEAIPASSEGAYPVPLKIGKNTQGEGVSFWLLHQKEHSFDLIYKVGAEEKKRFKDIKFISEANDHLILKSQEGIIYQVDVDFKCTIIGLEQDILKQKNPSQLQGYLKEKKDYAAVLSLKGYQDALSKPLMSWYDVRADRYYIIHYEGLPHLSYKGTTAEGSGLIYDQDQKALYTLEGIKAKDLDQHCSVTPQGAATIRIVSKREKLASGVKSGLSDGYYLQIENSESCIWRCDIKRSFRKWYLIGLGQDALKGRISSESLCEKIQKAKESLSQENLLTLKIPDFISVGFLSTQQVAFYSTRYKKIILVSFIEEKPEKIKILSKKIEILGVDKIYGYVNIGNIISQAYLIYSWELGLFPTMEELGEGKIKRIDQSLILLEGSLSKEALTLLRGIEDIKGFYINTAQVKKQDISLFHVNVPLIEEQERAPVVIALGKENVPYGEIQIHFDYNASAHYKIFKEQEDLIIGHGSGKKELIIKKAFFYAQRAKVEFHIQKGSSEKEVLPLEKIVKCIKSLASSSGESESKTIKVEDLVDLIRLSSNEIIKDSGGD